MTRSKTGRVLFSLLVTLSALAQTSSQPSTQITGAKVPDIVAFRLVFLSLSHHANASPEQVASQAARLAGTGLSAGDQQVLANQLELFQTSYDQIYNSSNAASDFNNRRDLLVQNIRDQLKSSISGKGFDQFNEYVQSEKNNMEVMQ